MIITLIALFITLVLCIIVLAKIDKNNCNIGQRPISAEGYSVDISGGYKPICDCDWTPEING